MDMNAECIKGPSKPAVDGRTVVVHVLGAAATVLVLVWCIRFRGGLALHSQLDKALIFNVHPVLMIIGLIVLAGEAILCYRSLPVSRDARKKAHLAPTPGASPPAPSACTRSSSSTCGERHPQPLFPPLLVRHRHHLPLRAPVARRLPRLLLPRRAVVPWHALLGLLFFAFAVPTAQLGFLDKLTFLQAPPLRLPKYGPEALLVNFIAVVVLLLGVVVVLATITVDSTSYVTFIYIRECSGILASVARAGRNKAIIE